MAVAEPVRVKSPFTGMTVSLLKEEVIVGMVPNVNTATSLVSYTGPD
jgi:hypothetical protein